MNRSRAAAAVLVGFLALASGARSDEPDATADPAMIQEQIARSRLNALRDAARNMRRLASDNSRAGGDPDRAEAYARWLRQARKQVKSLAGRWATNLDFYLRDFPPEALRKDPERLAYAAEWLGDINDSLSRQAETLRQQLLEQNAAFAPDVPAARIDTTRTVIEGIGS